MLPLHSLLQSNKTQQLEHWKHGTRKSSSLAWYDCISCRPLQTICGHILEFKPRRHFSMGTTCFPRSLLWPHAETFLGFFGVMTLTEKLHWEFSCIGFVDNGLESSAWCYPHGLEWHGHVYGRHWKKTLDHLPWLDLIDGPSKPLTKFASFHCFLEVWLRTSSFSSSWRCHGFGKVNPKLSKLSDACSSRHWKIARSQPSALVDLPWQSENIAVWGASLLETRRVSYMKSAFKI